MHSEAEVEIFSQLPLPRFNVNCDAATGFYGLAEEAFGVSGVSSSVVTCPAVETLSAGECEGAVSSCWSPGTRDTDCPANSLCCVSLENIILRNIIFFFSLMDVPTLVSRQGMLQTLYQDITMHHL